MRVAHLLLTGAMLCCSAPLAGAAEAPFRVLFSNDTIEIRMTEGEPVQVPFVDVAVR